MSEVKQNPNDPRKDKNIIFYDKESMEKMSEPSSGASELFQLMAMFIGIFAFMYKVTTDREDSFYID
jgi:hypothetical protein